MRNTKDLEKQLEQSEAQCALNDDEKRTQAATIEELKQQLRA